ncbi:hypothetical protein QA633_39905 [Bradyrhizobium barranii]|uniref:hypothetical protein n=1 Tax=Bradyrhizobium TaxID=374 RepID=UPI0024AF214A|nr:hypothetical protein [Bradyrhizobium barranii]WFT94364.1 hypothetical protein QA633_39905 [Bradyrhizobium barranii]
MDDDAQDTAMARQATAMIEQEGFGFELNEQSNLTDSMIVPGSDATDEFCVDLTSPTGKGLALVPKLVTSIIARWRLIDRHPQSFAVAASYQVTASGKRSLGFALVGLGLPDSSDQEPEGEDA